jgi:hypothetical protein
MHFAHQPQLNAHVQPLETKMAVGRENDEYLYKFWQKNWKVYLGPYLVST